LKAVADFPANGDDKAKAEWRKERGIPDSAEGYEPKVEGLVFGEADKPMVDSFKQHAHSKNWTPDQFNEALGWYAAEQEAIATQGRRKPTTSSAKPLPIRSGPNGAQTIDRTSTPCRTCSPARRKVSRTACSGRV
jgi:hypothetical protein